MEYWFDSKFWKEVLPVVSVLSSSFTAIAVVYLNGQQSQRNKEHEYNLAHKTSLLKKRFEVYNDFEAIAFALAAWLRDMGTGDEYLAVFRDSESFLPFRNKFLETKPKDIWLNEASKIKFLALYRAVNQAMKEAYPYTNDSIHEVGIKYVNTIRLLAIEFITFLQIDYHTLHEIQLRYWTPEALKEAALPSEIDTAPDPEDNPPLK